MKSGKGIKYMVMEGDQTLSGEHTMHYTDDVLENCISENNIILLKKVTPIHLT